MVCQVKYPGVDIVSHYILSFFSAGRKRSMLTINKHRIKSYPGGFNHLKSIVIVMSRFIRFLCASLNFVPINGLWKSLRNCPMKSPSDCLWLMVYKHTLFCFLFFFLFALHFIVLLGFPGGLDG